MRNPFQQSAPFRPLVLSLVAGCLTACSIDWPTPVSVQKDLSVAYPCQSRSCGCKDANQCWASCCCFSDAEKLAWAKANNVSPPEWFMQKMAAEKVAARKAEAVDKATVPQKSVSRQTSSCCCCKSKSDDCQPKIAESTADSTTVEVYLSVRQQRGCNGQLDFQLQHLVYPLPEVPLEEPELQLPHFVRFVPILSDYDPGPPTPPPRLSSQS